MIVVNIKDGNDKYKILIRVNEIDESTEINYFFDLGENCQL